MVKKGMIDRFEKVWAVVEMEDGEFIEISIETLPPDAREGSVIYIDDEGKVSVSIEETNERRKRIQALMDKLFED